MDKIFERDESCEKLLLSRANSYSGKKDHDSFESYIFTFIGEKYKKAASPYFGKAGKGDYLETLLDLANRVEKAQEKDERSRLLQALAIAIFWPDLLFKHQNSKSSVNEKSVRAFEQMLQQIYFKWDNFQEELSLCQSYITRGTTRINRPAETDRLVLKRDNLKNELDRIYEAYFYQLKALGLSPKGPPKIKKDENLFLNIYEKPWLLPLAHVILIRDAQYQMMGKVKYSDGELLQSHGLPFNIGQTTPEQKKQCDNLAFFYANQIRNVLARYLSDRQKSDCLSAFKIFFKAKQAERLKEDFSGLPLIWNWTNPLQIRKQMQEKISVFEAASFSVPACHVKSTALRIAKQLNLAPDQIPALERTLPKALWGKDELKKHLGSSVKKRRKKLMQFLDPLRTLMNPKEYFSDSQSNKIFSDKLREAATLYINGSGKKHCHKRRMHRMHKWSWLRRYIKKCFTSKI